MKLSFVISVIMSCVTLEQKAYSLLWAGKVLSRLEAIQLMTILQRDMRDLDYTVGAARKIYMQRLGYKT